MSMNTHTRPLLALALTAVLALGSVSTAHASTSEPVCIPKGHTHTTVAYVCGIERHGNLSHSDWYICPVRMAPRYVARTHSFTTHCYTY